MNEVVIKKEHSNILDSDVIKSMIFEIRGVQVILDSDLSKIYQVETKRINEAVRNNPEKFPERFSWILSDEEEKNLRSKISTSNLNNYGGRRYNTRVFTEQGALMLATILKSSRATNATIAIMDAFVLMRKLINSSLIDQNIIYNQVLQNTQDIKILQEGFKRLEEKPKTNIVFYDGQIFEARVKLIEIFNNANKQLIIIDNYADIILLDIIKNLNINVILITRGNILNKKDLELYNKNHNNLNVVYNNKFHDRYFIIDNNTFYHCGHSINSIGKSICQINLVTDEIAYKALSKKISEILSK